MDQSPHKVAHVITDKNGEKVLVDPEESLNSVMLWFYMLINIGACFGIATTYLAKIVGYWAAYLIPTILYLILPPLLWYLNPRLVKQPPGGSDLGNVFKVLGDIFANGGLKNIGRKGCVVSPTLLSASPPAAPSTTTTTTPLSTTAAALSRPAASSFSSPSSASTTAVSAPPPTP